MSTHLTPERLKVIQATAPAVAANIFKITPVFYDKMLGENPALYEFFNKSNQRNNRQPDAFGRAISPDDKDAGGQAATLSQSVLAAVAHLEHLEEIAGPAQRILHKHAALGIMPEHYQTVHDYFLKATAEVLGDAVTPEVADAWSGALLHVAEFFVKHETDLYDATTTKAGWDTRQAKEFTVFKVENASNCMKSIYFKPKDGKGLPAFTPGQYVTVKHNPTSAPHFAPRHYTLSSPTPIDGALRISVRHLKGTDGNPDGEMSSFLNTELKEGAIILLRHPFGTFTWKSSAAFSNVAFLTAGSGITPALAMIKPMRDAGKKVVHWHSDKSPEAVAHANEIEATGAKCIRYFGGRTNFSTDNLIEQLSDAGINLADSQTCVYLCMPPALLLKVRDAVEAAGVADKARCFYEPYGPGIV